MMMTTNNNNDSNNNNNLNNDKEGKGASFIECLLYAKHSDKSLIHIIVVNIHITVL